MPHQDREHRERTGHCCGALIITAPLANVPNCALGAVLIFAGVGRMESAYRVAVPYPAPSFGS
jgi:hypothetical protein